RRVAPAAGRVHRGRPAALAAGDAIHHAGDLPVHGALPGLAARAPRASPAGPRPGRRYGALRARLRSPYGPRCLAVAVRWWRVAQRLPAGRSSRALPHGGHGKATPAPINSGAGAVCPHPGVITRSWTDVHSSRLKAESIHGLSPRALVLPWPARKQLPARTIRRP